MGWFRSCLPELAIRQSRLDDQHAVEERLLHRRQHDEMVRMVARHEIERAAHSARYEIARLELWRQIGLLEPVGV